MPPQELSLHQQYMYRCIQLAKLGAGYVSPNPMVGAVLVHNNCIIGEGYHQQYGGAHAEVNCINSVNAANKHLISHATLYVSLEPCNHFGKTPPCSNLVVQHKIPRVVIGCKDIFSKVNGSGMQYLEANGVEVTKYVLEEECIALNKRFFTFHLTKKPYVFLKFAQANNNIIGNTNNQRLLISNNLVNKWVHQQRAVEDAILIGYNTALKDNPQLTNRGYGTKQPIRLVIDFDLSLPKHLHIFNTAANTVVFNFKATFSNNHIQYQKIEKNNIIEQILDYCYNHNIQSVIVEGGAKLLQLFIQNNAWNEAAVITNTTLLADSSGITAPVIKAHLTNSVTYENNRIDFYKPYKS